MDNNGEKELDKSSESEPDCSDGSSSDSDNENGKANVMYGTAVPESSADSHSDSNPADDTAYDEQGF